MSIQSYHKIYPRASYYCHEDVLQGIYRGHSIIHVLMGQVDFVH